MADHRIRSVRPQLFSWPPFAAMSDGAKVTYFAMLPLFDDEGRSPGALSYITAHIGWAKPLRPAVVKARLAELEAARIVVRYAVDGLEYIAITGWRDPKSPLYQYINRAQPSCLPPPSSTRSLNRSLSGSRQDRDPEGKGKDQDPEGPAGAGGSSSALPDPEPDPDPEPHPNHNAPRRPGDVARSLALLPDHAVKVDVHGNVTDARPFQAILAELDRGEQPADDHADAGTEP